MRVSSTLQINTHCKKQDRDSNPELDSTPNIQMISLKVSGRFYNLISNQEKSSVTDLSACSGKAWLDRKVMLMVKKGVIRWHHWCHMTSQWSATHCGVKRLVIYNKFCPYLDAEGRTEAGDNPSEFLHSSTIGHVFSYPPALMGTNIWNHFFTILTQNKSLLSYYSDYSDTLHMTAAQSKV